MSVWLRQGETRRWENTPAEQSPSYTGAAWALEGQKSSILLIYQQSENFYFLLYKNIYLFSFVKKEK